MPDKYELRCKRIPRKRLDKNGSVYGITWDMRVVNRTFDVMDMRYTSLEHTEENIKAVYIIDRIVAVKPSEGCSASIRKEIATLAKYTELWAIYPNYKRRVW